MAGGGMTVNVEPALAAPFTVTTTGPLVAPAGTSAVMLLAFHAVTDAVVPLNLTVLAPCVAPKFEPAIDTACPTMPDVGDSDEIDGGGTTVNVTPALAWLLTVTTTGPVVAEGTVAVMLFMLQFVVVAVTLLNLIVLVPFVAPKLAPAIVTDWPTTPVEGVSDEMLGFVVKVTPLLVPPVDITTTTGPVIAVEGTCAVMLPLVQFEVVAATPLNVTVPAEPKVVPVMFTPCPAVPEVGDTCEIDGSGMTVNVTPALA
jgi:hypothetical protein